MQCVEPAQRVRPVVDEVVGEVRLVNTRRRQDSVTSASSTSPRRTRLRPTSSASSLAAAITGRPASAAPNYLELLLTKIEIITMEVGG
jgi:hypothetical protein